MEAVGTDAADSGHPLEKHRWLRLALITISCSMCAGLDPGMCDFLELLVEAGVGSSKCTRIESTCDKQHIFVSEAFTYAGTMSSIQLFFIGWIFDRLGGYVLSQVGAGILAVGFVILQVPLLGAQSGHDDHTCSWLIIAITIADIGALMAMTSVWSTIWHFPDFQSVVAACVQMVSSGMGILPIIFSALMRAFGLSFSSMMLGWLILVVLAGICYRYTVPTIEEYRVQGAKVMGCMQQGAENTTFGQAFWNANLVVSQHWGMHALAILSVCMIMSFGSVFQGLLGDLSEVLFGSTEAGETLASTFLITSGIGGCIVVPLFAFASDYFNAGPTALLAGTVMLSMLTSILLVQTTWLAQVFTCVSVGVMNTLLLTYLMQYILAFAGQARLGSVMGLFTTYASLLSLFAQTGLYAWVSDLPSTSAEHLIMPLEVASVASTYVLIAFGSYITMRGLPEKPVSLAGDKGKA